MGKNDSLYSVLGLSKTADKNEIRAAYRRLAKQSHPDLHPGDKAAEDKFRSISNANDILGDEEKRARYDRGEIDATGAEARPAGAYREHADSQGPNQYYSSSGFEDISDVFSDLFGQRGGQGGGGAGLSMPGQDTHYTLGVDFLDAVNGTKTRVTMPDGRSLDVSIPPGTRDGQMLRLKGKGQPGLGDGTPGDALIAVSVRAHPTFKRKNDDILVDIPISLPEAILGGQIEVPTVSGTVSMTVPKGTNSSTTLRLKSKGVKARSGTGDQLVTLKIMLPKLLDEELTTFMEQWQASHSYDPRQAEREDA